MLVQILRKSTDIAFWLLVWKLFGFKENLEQKMASISKKIAQKNLRAQVFCGKQLRILEKKSKLRSLGTGQQVLLIDV